MLSRTCLRRASAVSVQSRIGLWGASTILAKPTHNLPPTRNIFYRGGPFEVFNGKPTVAGRIWRLVPLPMRALGLFMGSAAVLFFIATPLLIICGPPVALGLWWYGRKFQRMQKELYHQRWSDMGNRHLVFQEAESVTNASTRMPIQARDRVIRALEDDEQGIASELGLVNDWSQVAFSPVESIHQDFKASSQGFQQQMDVSQYGMLDQERQHRIATVVVVRYRDLPSKSNDKMRIEIETLGLRKQIFVLEKDDEEEVVIDVKGH